MLQELPSGPVFFDLENIATLRFELYVLFFVRFPIVYLELSCLLE